MKYYCRGEDLVYAITFEGVLVAFVKIVVAIEFYQIMPAVENRLSATIQLKNMTTYFDHIVQFVYYRQKSLKQSLIPLCESSSSAAGAPRSFSAAAAAAPVPIDH